VRITPFGTAVASAVNAMLGTKREVVMWRITTRGFTLQEVLILAAMNIAARGVSDQGNVSKSIAE
jgi:hypothetical protein